MSLTKLLLSKLVQACEEDWMPENNGGLFGEPKLVTDNLQELKRLIYRPKNQGTSIKMAKENLIKK